MAANKHCTLLSSFSVSFSDHNIKMLNLGLRLTISYFSKHSNAQFGLEDTHRERRMGNCRPLKSSWSDLYPEIIASISQHLKTRFDILSFRGVCKQWREHSVLPPPNFLSPLLPHRFLTKFNTRPTYFYNHGDRFDGQLALVVKSIYLLTSIVEIEASPSCWMVMATELEPGKIQLRHPLNGGQIENLPMSMSKTLDLTQFKIYELAQGYEVLYSNRVSKVVLSDFTAIVLCYDGNMGAIRLSGGGGDLRATPDWYKPRGRLDDIVSFKGIHVAVDPHGKLFSMEFKAEASRLLVATGVLTADLICNKNGGRKKRLVVDPISNKLYLVEMEYLLSEVGFKVYEFHKECKRWVKVGTICHYRTLFVGVNHCFLAPAQVGCLANCIVFDSCSFPEYKSDGNTSYGRLWGNRKPVESIGVYHLGKHKFSYISDYPELVQMMQPPPACFPSSQRESNELQPELNIQGDPRLGEEVSPPSVRPESQEQTPEIPSTKTPTMNDVEASNRETPMEEITHSTSTSFVASLTQCDKSHTTSKFEGLDIRSCLVPTLQSIWLKHGNIIENSIVLNSELIARALELLANVVIILKGNSARSLNDSQADYLSSTLSDLRSMCFKVDWLVPIVQKALALHKIKPWVDSLNRLRKFKDQVALTRSKHLKVAKLDEMMKECEEIVATVSNMIPFKGEVDLDLPLGEGLT